MDFSLTDDHLALRDAVRRFCDGEYPAQHRGAPETQDLAARRWSGMAELGLLGLSFDTAFGGSGQGPVEAMLVAQELGRALGGGAWFANIALAGPLLSEAGTPEQCAQWLPRIAAGELKIALAAGEAEARYDLADVQTTATRDADGYLLDGRKTLVLDGDSAQLLLVVARTAGGRADRDGLTLFAVDAASPGVRVHGFDTLDGRRAAHVDLKGVRMGPDRVIGPAGGAWPLLDAAMDCASAALCAEAAGALEALIELTLEHLRTRKQFGAPLAKFQALQHRVADLGLMLEQAKSMACAAAMAVEDAAPAQRRRLVSAAKAWIGPMGRQAGLTAIQLHGAMGMTDECHAGRYAKRLLVIGQLCGDARHHLRRFAEQPPA